MKRKLLFILAVFAALAVGYYFGAHQASAPSDIVRSYTASAPLSRSVTQSFITSAQKPTATPKAKVNSYILNKSTKKFHKPNCSSVKQMNESNKIYFTGSREEVIEKGYKPCGRCNP